MKSTTTLTNEAIETAARRYKNDVAIVRMMVQSKAGMDFPDREIAEAFLRTLHVGRAYHRIIEKYAEKEPKEPRRSYVDEGGNARELDKEFLNDAQRGRPEPGKHKPRSNKSG